MVEAFLGWLILFAFIWMLLSLFLPTKIPPKFERWPRVKVVFITITIMFVSLIVDGVYNAIQNPSIATTESKDVNAVKTDKKEETVNEKVKESIIDTQNIEKKEEKKDVVETKTISRSNYEKFASLELGDDFSFVTNLFGAQPIRQEGIAFGENSVYQNIFELEDLKFIIVSKNNKIISKELWGWDYRAYRLSEDILDREKQVKPLMSYDTVKKILKVDGFIVKESINTKGVHKKLYLWPVVNGQSFEFYFEDDSVRFKSDETTPPGMYIVYAPEVDGK